MNADLLKILSSQFEISVIFSFFYLVQSFIAKFKTAELSASTKKPKTLNVLTPLLFETFDPFDTTK